MLRLDPRVRWKGEAASYICQTSDLGVEFQIASPDIERTESSFPRWLPNRGNIEDIEDVDLPHAPVLDDLGDGNLGHALDDSGGEGDLGPEIASEVEHVEQQMFKTPCFDGAPRAFMLQSPCPFTFWG